MSRVAVSVAAALLAIGCARPTPPIEAPVTNRTTDDARASGVEYLLKRQSEDGAWRSDVYATFKDGTALTPLVLTALQDARDAGEPNAAVETAIKKGLTWLARLSTPDGAIDAGPDGLDYPVYTAALTIKALSHPTGRDFVQHRSAWVNFLLDRQLTEKLGWKKDDKQFGGWGYCRVIPRKPDPNAIAPPLIESNLSATLFALDALKAAGEQGEEVYLHAELFVRRCQNNDGGFHFIYDDPVRNKAGLANAEPPTFHSYGSTTADGVRALAITEPIRLRIEGVRVKPGVIVRRNTTPLVKSVEWLIQNFRADTHPGTYVKAHELNREAVYYYYVASAAKAFREHKLELPDGRDWTAELGAELVKRQHKDGRWENPVELVRENDPLVATANAVSTLAHCAR
jgi:hypothetical protein